MVKVASYSWVMCRIFAEIALVASVNLCILQFFIASDHIAAINHQRMMRSSGGIPSFSLAPSSPCRGSDYSDSAGFHFEHALHPIYTYASSDQDIATAAQGMNQSKNELFKR